MNIDCTRQLQLQKKGGVITAVTNYTALQIHPASYLDFVDGGDVVHDRHHRRVERRRRPLRINHDLNYNYDVNYINQ